MNRIADLILQLNSIRNRYEKEFAKQKEVLLTELEGKKISGAKSILSYHSSLLFLIAYPDNDPIQRRAISSLEKLHQYISKDDPLQYKLYNSGITNTKLCAAFSFEIVRWLREKHPKLIRLESFEMEEAQIQSILSVVMPKVESEIFQDGNDSWKPWLNRSLKKAEEILDALISIFKATDIRPEVKDELWSAIGINVEIDLRLPDLLPAHLVIPYYHRSLLRKKLPANMAEEKLVKVELNKSEAEAIIQSARMVLVRHLREIDPVSFSTLSGISYYQLPRGFSIALMDTLAERRHPIDSYLGYTVFKNGLPVAYAGSWIFFDSCRIGLNVFPSYRGGESQYIFSQVLRVHREVYRLKRFTVDPYQIGKDNSDGIQSGSFWVYYHAGFHPIENEQKKIAKEESLKIRNKKGYRSSSPILKKLADSRMELVMDKKAVPFDATDLSRVYAKILNIEFNNDRKYAEEIAMTKMKTWLAIKDPIDMDLQFLMKNWGLLLFPDKESTTTPFHNRLKKKMISLFQLKVKGTEAEYIEELQKIAELKNYLEKLVKNYS